jgi:hypothetical protein
MKNITSNGNAISLGKGGASGDIARVGNFHRQIQREIDIIDITHDQRRMTRTPTTTNDQRSCTSLGNCGARGEAGTCCCCDDDPSCA